MRPIRLDRWLGEVLSFRNSALHVEQHPFYAGDLLAMVPWLAGDTTPPQLGEGVDPWADQTRPLLRSGGRLERLRLHRDDPTPYQRWLRWVSPRRIEAGEVHRYLHVGEAEQLGLVPVQPFPGRDWWLLDDARLLVFEHDRGGRLVGVEQTEDDQHLSDAQAWWQRAIRHASVETLSMSSRPG